MASNSDVNMAQHVIDGAVFAQPVCRHLINGGCYWSDCHYNHDVDGHTPQSKRESLSLYEWSERKIIRGSQFELQSKRRPSLNMMKVFYVPFWQEIQRGQFDFSK